MLFTLCNNTNCTQNLFCLRHMKQPNKVQEYQYRKPEMNIPHKFKCEHFVDFAKYKKQKYVINARYQY